MKAFIVFSAILMPIFAFNEGNVQVTQDTLGNYNLKFVSPDISRTEERTLDGRVIGSYTFVDTDGVRHTINYVSGAGEGFKASGSSLPVAPVSVAEPLEVIHARQEHLAAFAKEQATVSYTRHVEHPVNVHEVLASLTVPKLATLPASDVPEVDAEHYAIKADLAKAYAEALEKLAQEYRSRQ